MVDLSLVEDWAVKKNIISILSKHKILWSGRPETNNATRHTINLKGGTHPILQQLHHVRHRSQEVLCECIYIQLRAVVIKPAQLEWVRFIARVPKKKEPFRFVCCTPPLYKKPAPFHIKLILLTEKRKCLQNWTLYEDTGNCQSMIRISSGLHFCLTMVLTATPVCHLAYTTHLLRSNARWMLSNQVLYEILV